MIRIINKKIWAILLILIMICVTFTVLSAAKQIGDDDDYGETAVPMMDKDLLPVGKQHICCFGDDDAPGDLNSGDDDANDW